jgi:hypothetical protein
MTLRLILVGLVAALGLTIPSRMDCKRFLCSAQSRASSFLAAWDTWRPGDGSYHRNPGSTATRECELCRLARAQVALRTLSPAAKGSVDPTASARVSSPLSHEPVSAQSVLLARTASNAVLAFEPSDVDIEIWEGLALELNPQSEGIDLKNATPSDSSRPSALAATSYESVDRAWVDAVCGRLVGEVRAATMVAPSSSQSDVPTIQFDATTALRLYNEQPVTTGRTDDLSNMLSDDAPSSGEWSSGYGADLFAAIDDKLDQIEANDTSAVAHKVACNWLESESAPPAVGDPNAIAVTAAQDDVQRQETASAQIPWPVFAPEKSVAELATRGAEVIEVPWPVFAPSEQAVRQPNVVFAGSKECGVPRDSTSTAPAVLLAANPSVTETPKLTPDWGRKCPSSIVSVEPVPSTNGSAVAPTPRESCFGETRWTQAVHLTREAVVAWMKVLAGPALVEVSAQ